MITKYQNLRDEYIYTVNFPQLSPGKVLGSQLKKTMNHLEQCGINKTNYQLVENGQLKINQTVNGYSTSISIDLPKEDRMPKETHEIKVTFNNGYTLETRINGTVEEINDYYNKSTFNTAEYPREEFSTVKDIHFYN